MITIDGSLGEGGGQVLRTSLSLSMITGEPLSIINIRAGRKKPGLMRQHLTAVRAAAEVSAASVEGDAPGSTELEFRPGTMRHGDYTFSVGTAGSATLVLQTVLPALLAVDGTSEITLEGGTHNPMAPPFDFLERTFAPLLRRMGAEMDVHLTRHGFYPAGGGGIHVTLRGGGLRPLSLTRRENGGTITAACLYSGLPSSIAKREAAALAEKIPALSGKVAVTAVDSAGPGNAVVIDVVNGDGQGGEHREVFTGFGEKGVSAEKVAGSVAREALQYIASGAATGKHTADQLLLPLALADGGEFTTQKPSMHTTTNLQVITLFLPCRFDLRELGTDLYSVTCTR